MLLDIAATGRQGFRIASQNLQEALMDIVALLQCLQPAVSRTTLRQFSRVVVALLAMTGRVTMLGISRWAGQGGSYRTVQRFFSQALPWAMLFWVSFRQHVYRADGSTCWWAMKSWPP